MRIRTVGLWQVLLALAALGAAVPAAQQPGNPLQTNTALLLEVRDAIGPATSDFFLRTLKAAQERRARLVIVQMDTPGGLDSATRDMVRAILASPVPVAMYVSPSGARAASAGTYLMYASHIAAMAPATNLGAATPVQIGAPTAPRGGESGAAKQEEQSREPAAAMERKVVNDSVAYLRGLAELRGRNADWAESSVRSGASLSATAALEQKVIDFIAVDVADLLAKADGRTVKLGQEPVRLTTAGLAVERVEIDWRTQLLAVLTNPNVAYLLMLIGVYGLLLEGYNPGAVLPGVAGAICLLLALYAFQVLSVNYAGLGLMLLGIALLIAEAFAPSFGVLGLGGIVAFTIGSIILMDTGVPGFQIARTLIGGMAFAGALMILLLGSYFARARKRPVVTGVEQLLSEPATALADFDGSGPVQIRGEIWNAIASTPVKRGQRLRVRRVSGLTLQVEPEIANHPPAQR